MSPQVDGGGLAGGVARRSGGGGGGEGAVEGDSISRVGIYSFS